MLCNRGNMYCGGQGVYLYYLSRELQRLGHQVHVIVGPPYPQLADGIIVHKVTNLNFFEAKSHFLPQSNPFQVFTPLNFYELGVVRLGVFPEMFSFSIRAYLKVRESLARTRFDIIHDNQTLGYGMLLMKSFRIPVVATIHHPLPIDRKADLAQAANFREKLERIMFYPFFMQHIVARSMDRVIAVSQSSAEEVRNIFGVSPEKLRVVHNGIDTDVFRRMNGVKKPYSLITVANTQDRKKGVVYLLQAVNLLSMELDVRLTMVDDPASGFASRLVKKYDLQGRVAFTGRLSTEELVKYYNSAEVAVTASVYEGFGLPAAEAMACGVPVVATRAGALPEIVDHGANGILVPPADARALAEAIRQLLLDGALRKRMGEQGRRKIEQRFSWRDAALKTLAVYEEML